MNEASNPGRAPGPDGRKRTGTGGATVRADPSDTLLRVRAALREVVPNLVALVRAVPDADAASVGTWTVGEVAAHVSHSFRADADAIAGRPVPEAVVTKAGIAEAAARLLAEDRERDPVALADRIDRLANEFDEIASCSRSTTVDWLQGTRVPASMAACHLLDECLIHGQDIADATGLPWPIRQHHAVLAMESFVLPLIATLPPTALVDQERAGSFRARIELRLRGGQRTVLVLDHGALTLERDVRNVDAHISADPATLLLVLIGRRRVWKPLLRGKIVGWGVRPWKLPRMLAALSPP